MTRNAVEVENLGKRYWLGEDQPGRSAREVIVRRLRRFGGSRQRPRRQELWSLRNVSFELVEGHALGVIGRNGAGKSTLLKILSRITQPTTGVTRTRGRVASLLEVGTGFHAELTGRENIYLNGAVLGMTRREITRRFDAIVEFAGVGRFLDTPIKRYSTGMHLRLAFAVAAHLEPDILVVDEVLAVGDAEFQRKCLGRMADVEREGRTVVYVSHDLEAIARLCPTAMWLEGGKVCEAGESDKVIDAYLRAALGPRTGTGMPGGPGLVRLLDVAVRTESGDAAEVLRRDRPFFIDVRLSLDEEISDLDVAIHVDNGAGLRVFDEALSDTVQQRPSAPGIYDLRLLVPPILNTGEYRVGVWVGTVYDDEFHYEPVAARFHLEGSVKKRPGRAVELLLPWEWSPMEPAAAADLGSAPPAGHGQ